VYNIFAFAAMIPLIFIIPRLTSSMHPGSGGNPGFNAYDLDSRMRLVFYPAVLAWFLIGLWIVNIRVRIKKLEEKSIQ
jgi:heme exporter protein C